MQDEEMGIADDGDDDEHYDSPNGSIWIISVDFEGKVFILDRPNIHYSFFDCGGSAEDIGLPFETDLYPGVYRWKCEVRGGRDEFTGEYWGPEWDVVEEDLLWSLEQIEEKNNDNCN